MSSSAVRLRATEAPETDLVTPIRDVSYEILRLLVPHILASRMAKPTFWALHYLDRSHEVHPGRLARRIGVTPAACTASVDQLVALGYVARRPSVEDRRQVLLEVTPKGRRVLDTVWRRFDASLRDVLSGVPAEDLDVTARTLASVAALLRTSGPEGAPGVRA